MTNINIIDFITLFFSISAFLLASIAYFRTKPKYDKTIDIKSKKEKLKDKDFSNNNDEPADINTEEFRPFE